MIGKKKVTTVRPITTPIVFFVRTNHNKQNTGLFGSRFRYYTILLKQRLNKKWPNLDNVKTIAH